jgi:hypothetical protein
VGIIGSKQWETSTTKGLKELIIRVLTKEGRIGDGMIYGGCRKSIKKEGMVPKFQGKRGVSLRNNVSMCKFNYTILMVSLRKISLWIISTSIWTQVIYPNR